MILGLVFGAVNNLRVMTYARLVQQEFTERGVEAEVLIQTISGSGEPVILDKDGGSIVHERPYVLIFGVADLMSRNMYPSTLRQLSSNFEESLQKKLEIPVYVIS